MIFFLFFKIDPKYYCPHCFDVKTNKEAIQSKYKCSNCFNCPSCQHTLTTRGSSIAAKTASPSTTPTPTSSSPETQQVQQPQKVFYLACGYCRWSTRDAGIPDATISRTH